MQQPSGIEKNNTRRREIRGEMMKKKKKRYIYIYIYIYIERERERER